MFWPLDSWLTLLERERNDRILLLAVKDGCTAADRCERGENRERTDEADKDDRGTACVALMFSAEEITGL